MSLTFLPDKPSVFLASDLHLGAPDAISSREREMRFIAWMDSIQEQAAGLILLGDIFDFWFEYKTAIPKGFSRIQGRLGIWRDAGIPVYIFTGNHDLWMKDYFQQEFGIPVFHQGFSQTILGHSCYLAHGDGLGPGDHGFKAMKKLFTNPLAQWLFRWLHPDLGIPLAEYFSGSSRKAHRTKDEIHYGENEFLYQFVKTHSIQHPEIKYYIFGHRHRAEEIEINASTKLFNLGDWIRLNTYLEIKRESLQLQTYPTT